MWRRLPPEGTYECVPAQADGGDWVGRFLAGGDSKDAQTRRNNTFKLVPRVTKGSWIVKQAVGTTPCLLGNKLQTKYFQ